MSVFSRLFGSVSDRFLRSARPIVERINAHEERIRNMTPEAMRERMGEIIGVLSGASENRVALDEVLPEVFALVRESASRTLGQRHYDVQLLGGIALHQGNVAEMRTGEGKTLVATLPVTLNALTKKGVHVVTVNDYLARRDMVWMGQIYYALGLSIGCIAHDSSFVYDPKFRPDAETQDADRDATGSFRVHQEFLRPCTRREAYACDITYGTNNEFGFDWLRDNLEHTSEALRQRGHYFAIVDEVDSILIDEARTPLIISAPDAESEDLYKTFSHIVPRLVASEDYEIDEKLRAATLTEAGITKVESILKIGNLYAEHGVRYVHHLEQALRAHTLYKRDRDYVVKDGGIMIVDEFTGRLMPGRRWSEGLHQAIEAKENVEVQKESRTLASITFQNYFRMYKKLSGMTGTAVTSTEEFQQVYNLSVMSIPTHRSMIRNDRPDRVYQTENGKWKALASRIAEEHAKGRPVLVGTVSIEKNEKLSEMLSRKGVRHEMLNAKNHEREGEIIAQAGRKGAVTVATNMAGRGVDIILGGNPVIPKDADEVRSSGGLLVLGTERHEARRIDNQLRGRAGRQGDPGETQFYVSFEDDLLRIFAPDRLKRLMGTFGIPEDEPIESGMVSKSIEAAQSKIEGFHFDARKHVLEFDNVLSRQRSAVYRDRSTMLLGDHDAVIGKAREFVNDFTENLFRAHMSGIPDVWDTKGLREAAHAIFGEAPKALENPIEDVEAFRKDFVAHAEHVFDERVTTYPTVKETARSLYLQIVDHLWRDHLEVMEYARSSVRLRAYGQHDPLVEYKNEAIRLFRTFNVELRDLFVQNFFKATHAQSMTNGQLSATAPRPSTPSSLPATSYKPSASSKVGRNDPCPCGAVNPTTKEVYKYKKCGLINASYHNK